jgi:hypothetical protein
MQRKKYLWLVPGVVSIPVVWFGVFFVLFPRFRSELVDKGVDIAAGGIENLIGSGIVAVLGLLWFQRLSIEREVKIRRRLRMDALESQREGFVQKVQLAGSNRSELSQIVDSWLGWMAAEGLRFVGDNQKLIQKWNANQVWVEGSRLHELGQNIGSTELE